ncbi:MAG: SDR family NAD(P)-dependent oxidoreductase [Candidatus Krumholzibacteriia bacterium]
MSRTAHKKTALITGASFGIGYELARQFGRAGYDLVLVARNEDKLDEVAAELTGAFGIDVGVVPKDLTADRAPDKIFEKLHANSITIDVLVNNAGFGTRGLFYKNEMGKELDMIRLNIMALVHLTRLFLPSMVERGNGKILNVASTAAFQPGPLMAVYYATKAFVVSFSEAVSNEVEGTGVTVTALCPGPTYTEFQKRAGIEQSKLFGRGMVMTAEDVAVQGYQALMEGKGVVITGFKNKLLAGSVRFAPRRLIKKVVRSMNENR